MASYNAPYKYLVILGLALLLTECSIEKNTDTTRFYHNMTARYNIYFNGYENLKEGVAKISTNYRDDYAEVLKVFEFSDPSTPSFCSSDMERAIQKASKLISLKSMTAKPKIDDKNDISEKDRELLDRKEYNDWVDDSYLLIGKARFYKHEYKEAAALFEYCITAAGDKGIKDEATIWLARVHNENGNYNESLRILTELGINSESSKAFQSMYNSTMADLFIKQKRYSEAIDPLKRAVAQASGKKTKYRLTFLLAQLYDINGNPSEATSYYKKVIKMRPPYEVEFYARIKLPGVLDVETMNTQEIRRELEKMLKDSKNRDFQDQIYYALGNLSMREGNEEEAIRYFRLSASAPSINQNQKGRSYLALADYYYKKPAYMDAGIYYDSAMFFIDEKYPGYQALKTKSQSLNALVDELRIIQTEDSLQKVASMSDPERNAVISGIIAQITKAESEGKTSDYSDRYNMGQFYENERRFQGQIDQEGKWYFYNQSALAFGRTEFRRRWGERRLEDNWRRSNKAIVAIMQDEQEGDSQQQKSDTAKAKFDNKSPEFYLQNLPLNDSLLAISNEKIATAMLNAGRAYAERINDTAKATDTWEALTKRYPDNELVPEALFNLYRLNKEINSPKSETYRQELLTSHSESEFARILSDPAYYEKKMADIRLAGDTYQKAYDLYIAENFNESIVVIDDALKKFPQDNLAPKFMLLRAYCVARLTDERGFKEELTKLIKTWPKSEEGRKANEISAYLNQKLPELKVEEDRQIAQELYIADTAKTHLFALVIVDPAFNINQATFDVISYNIDNYTNKNYRTEGTLVDNKFILITVSGFPDYMTSLDYYNSFLVEKNVRNVSGSKMYSFIINDDNLLILKGDKNPDRYNIFFIEKYLR
ncbi:MAG: tetratricopeptide repeat protein [Bacteroidetes bacterium]|nr:tetratricopeptide repeat protein [Bacteroidota bacterium]